MMDIQLLLNVFLILETISMVHADEEYSYEDFAVDVGSGVAIAACEKDPACSNSMPAIMTIGFIIGGISSCICPKSNSEDNVRKRKKEGEHIGNIGLGYIVGRALL